MRKVRINRGERQTPFLSNIVKGGATQITPNGCAVDQQHMEETGEQGSPSGKPSFIAPESWSGNRSGE